MSSLPPPSASIRKPSGNTPYIQKYVTSGSTAGESQLRSQLLVAITERDHFKSVALEAKAMLLEVEADFAPAMKQMSDVLEKFRAEQALLRSRVLQAHKVSVSEMRDSLVDLRGLALDLSSTLMESVTGAFNVAATLTSQHMQQKVGKLGMRSSLLPAAVRAAEDWCHQRLGLSSQASRMTHAKILHAKQHRLLLKMEALTMQFDATSSEATHSRVLRELEPLLLEMRDLQRTNNSLGSQADSSLTVTPVLNSSDAQRLLVHPHRESSAPDDTTQDRYSFSQPFPPRSESTVFPSQEALSDGDLQSLSEGRAFKTILGDMGMGDRGYVLREIGVEDGLRLKPEPPQQKPVAAKMESHAPLDQNDLFSLHARLKNGENEVSSDPLFAPQPPQLSQEQGHTAHPRFKPSQTQTTDSFAVNGMESEDDSVDFDYLRVYSSAPSRGESSLGESATGVTDKEESSTISLGLLERALAGEARISLRQLENALAAQVAGRTSGSPQRSRGGGAPVLYLIDSVDDDGGKTKGGRNMEGNFSSDPWLVRNENLAQEPRAFRVHFSSNNGDECSVSSNATPSRGNSPTIGAPAAETFTEGSVDVGVLLSDSAAHHKPSSLCEDDESQIEEAEIWAKLVELYKANPSEGLDPLISPDLAPHSTSHMIVENTGNHSSSTLFRRQQADLLSLLIHRIKRNPESRTGITKKEPLVASDDSKPGPPISPFSTIGRVNATTESMLNGLRRDKASLSAALAQAETENRKMERERAGLNATVGDLSRRIQELVLAQRSASEEVERSREEVRETRLERLLGACSRGDLSGLNKVLSDEEVDALTLSVSESQGGHGVEGEDEGGQVYGEDKLPLILSRDSHGRTPLIYAVKLASLRLCEKLSVATQRAIYGLDLKRRSSTVASPLTSDALSDELLVQFFDVRDDNDRSPIQYAARCGRADVVAWLVSNGVDMCQKDRHGLTPLHQGVLARSLAVVRLLLSLGTDVMTQDSAGATPYSLAVQLLKDEDTIDGRAIVVILRSWILNELPEESREPAGLRRSVSSGDEAQGNNDIWGAEEVSMCYSDRRPKSPYAPLYTPHLSATLLPFAGESLAPLPLPPSVGLAQNSTLSVMHEGDFPFSTISPPP